MLKYKCNGCENPIVLDGNGNKLTLESYTAANKVNVLNPFRYRSYYYDTETGLYFLQTRYYDPEIGRFITIDDISYLAPDTINGLNLYAYCNNNPVMRTDSQGTSWWDNVKNWFKDTSKKLINTFLTGGLGVLGVGILEINNSSSNYKIGNFVMSTFGFNIGDDIDIGIDLESGFDRFIRGLRHGIESYGDFIKKNWDRKFAPAWNWLNGDKWYQILAKNILFLGISIGVSSLLGPISPAVIVGSAVVALITLIWDIIDKGWNN